MRPYVWVVMAVSAFPAVAQTHGVAIGGGAGIVKPEGLGIGVLADLEARVAVAPAVAVAVGLSGWHVRETDTVTVQTGPGTTSQQALTYPVTDLALSAGLLYTHSAAARTQVFAGGGGSLHYLVSDLAALAIDGDSELRPGGYGLVGVERQVARRIGLQASARIDVLRRATHFRSALGLRYYL